MARKLSNGGGLAATAVILLLAGCYRHPKLDVESLPCTSSDNCPTGSTCDLQTHRCSFSGSLRSDTTGGSSAQGNVLIIGSSGTATFISTDSGLTWTGRWVDIPFGVDSRNGVAVSASGTTMVVMGSDNYVYTSTGPVP